MRRKLFFNLLYWFSNPPWDTNLSPPELMQHIKTYPAGRALDLGCGTATNVITLAQHGWQVVGIDFAGRAIRKGRKKAKQVGVDVELHVGDATQLDFLVRPFDLILDMGCLHGISFERHDAYHQNLLRLLAPNGTFMLYTMLHQSPEQEGPGLTEAQIAAFSPALRLTHRDDGTNQGNRASAWLWFQKPDADRP